MSRALPWVGLAALLVLAGALWVVREARQRALERSIELVGIVCQPRGKVGKPLPVEFRLRNGGSEPAWVVTGDAECGGGFQVRVYDSKGVDRRNDAVGCGMRAFVERDNFIELRPGGSTAPLRDKFSRWWTPRAPGRYTVSARYNYRPADLDFRWVPFRDLSEELSESLHPLVRRTFRLQRTIQVVVEVDP